MNIEVKNSVKPVEYTQSMKILEKRVNDVISGKKGEFLWILDVVSLMIMILLYFQMLKQFFHNL